MIIPYVFIGMYMPKEWRVYSFIEEIAAWIQQQPVDMWKEIESTGFNPIFYKYPYAVSEELDSWIELKWG